MNETKWTKGKWEAGERRDGSIWLSIGDPKTGPHFQGDIVCTPWDARLIITAPELYEVLEAAQEELRLLRMKDTRTVYSPTLREKISIVLAKARGEA
jgi:hypothetical protein